MQTIVALLLILAVSHAQVTEISSGVLTSGTLAPLSGSDYRTQLNYYKVWIPENTMAVQTTFVTTAG